MELSLAPLLPSKIAFSTVVQIFSVLLSIPFLISLNCSSMRSRKSLISFCTSAIVGPPSSTSMKYPSMPFKRGATIAPPGIYVFMADMPVSLTMESAFIAAFFSVSDISEISELAADTLILMAGVAVIVVPAMVNASIAAIAIGTKPFPPATSSNISSGISMS